MKTKQMQMCSWKHVKVKGLNWLLRFNIGTMFVHWSGIYAYITLKERVSLSDEEIENDLRQMVKEKIAAYAVPEMMQVTVLKHNSSV